jgi:hypothetical protein
MYKTMYVNILLKINSTLFYLIHCCISEMEVGSTLLNPIVLSDGEEEMQMESDSDMSDSDMDVPVQQPVVVHRGMCLHMPTNMSITR